MQITVEIPESIVSDAVNSAWKSTFAAGDYSRTPPEGYRTIRYLVDEHAKSKDTLALIRDLIKSASAELAPKIVRQCVEDELRKMVKKIAKEERETLFNTETKP